MRYLRNIVLLIYFATTAAVALQAAVTPGAWCTDLNAAKSYAVQHKMPLFVFYGADGCSYCKKGETALNTTTFKNWMAKRKIVMLKIHVSEWKDDAAWKFASNNWQADLFPACRVWWPKTGSASSGVVGRAFVGRLSYSYVRSFAGSQLQDKLINIIESFIGSWKTSSSTATATSSSSSNTSTSSSTTKKPTTIKKTAITVSASTTTTASTTTSTTATTSTSVTSSADWKSSRQLVGAVYEGNEIVGTCQVKCGKANKKGTAKVSAKVVLFDGSKTSFSAQKVEASTSALTVTWSKGDGLSVTISGAGVSGTSGSVKIIPCEAGGAFTGRHSLSLSGWSGGDTLDFNASGSKWTFTASDDVYKSRLSYNAKTGAFKGTLKLKEEVESDDDEHDKVKTKKISLKVIGAVLEKGIYGYGTCKSFETTIEGD